MTQQQIRDIQERSIENVLAYRQDTPRRDVNLLHCAYIILDTGAITNLYHRFGETAFSPEHMGTNGLYVLTDQVMEELESQYQKRNFAVLSEEQCREFNTPNRTPRTPYQLLNLLYSRVGDGTLDRTPVSVDDDADLEIRTAMREGSAETGNTRIGKGDISLLALAKDLSPGPVYIVSPDSDLPNTLGAMGVKGVYCMDENMYASAVGLSLDKAA